MFEEEDFRNQFLLILTRELTGHVIENKWWDNLQSVIRSFVADYNRRPNRDRLAGQTVVESRLDGANKSGDSEEVILAWAELPSSLIKLGLG